MPLHQHGILYGVNGILPDSPDKVVDSLGVDFLDGLLRNAHELSRVRPISGADANGVFPAAHGLQVLGLANDAPPVIPDTNLLRDDIRRTVSRRERGVLLSAANAGAIRLLCPAHVADEIVEHTIKFAGDLDATEFSNTWTRDYLPLMRIVGDLNLALFATSETQRIHTLMDKDPDDVPAAKLSIASGGFFLSADQNALEAVYGPGDVLQRDVDGHTKWVNALMSWGDSHELAQIIEAGALVARLGGTTVTGGYRRARGAPVLAAAGGLLAVGSLVDAYRRSDLAGRGRFRRGMTSAVGGILELLVRQADLAAEIGRLGAPQPASDELAALTGEGRLARSCIYRLARHPQPIVTARQMSDLLPNTLSPRGETKVRQVLRANDAIFDQPYRGWFQLGTAHPNTLTVSVSG